MFTIQHPCNLCRAITLHIQPEYPGEWMDVLRLMIPEGQSPLAVHVRVYATTDLPVLSDFETTLNPGEWQGYALQPAKVRAG